MSDKETLFVLDFDGTMIRGDSIREFVNGEFDFLDLLYYYFLSVLYKIKIFEHNSYKKRVALLTEKYFLNKNKVFQEFWRKLYDKRLSLTKLSEHTNCEVVIISATPHALVSFALNDIEKDNVHVLGSGSEFYHGEQKLYALEEYLNKSEKTYDYIAGFGDSGSDLALRKYCDIFYLVKNERVVSCHAKN